MTRLTLECKVWLWWVFFVLFWLQSKQSQQSRGRLKSEEWDVSSSVRFGLLAVKSEWVNSQLLVLASPLLALLHLWLAYLTRVWMHLLGSIHTLLNPYTREPIIFLHCLEVLVQVLRGAPSPSFARCYRWTGAWPRWLQIFLQILC